MYLIQKFAGNKTHNVHCSAKYELAMTRAHTMKLGGIIYTVPPKCKLTVFFELSIESRSSILARIEDRVKLRVF